MTTYDLTPVMNAWLNLEIRKKAVETKPKKNEKKILGKTKYHVSL